MLDEVEGEEDRGIGSRHAGPAFYRNLSRTLRSHLGGVDMTREEALELVISVATE
jgi:hypothetical protein